MAIFYSDSASFNDVDVSGSMSLTGSGNILSVSGSRGGLLSVSDITAGANIFQITSGSIDIFKIDQSKNVIINGTMIVTGSILGSGSVVVSAQGSSNNISQLIFSNSNNVSFGLNGSTLTATADPGAGFSFSYFNPADAYQQITGILGSNSLYFQPVQAPNVVFDRVAIPIYLSHAAASTFAATLSFYWGLYTRNASTLSLLTNYSTAFGSQLSFSSTNSSLYHGIRLWTAGITNTLTEGQYYLGIMSRATTAGNAQSLSNIVISQQNSSFSGLFGVSTAATNQYTRGLGLYTATTSNLPSAVAFSEINGQSSQFLRPPVFYIISQTF